jgi:hypothetical protein
VPVASPSISIRIPEQVERRGESRGAVEQSLMDLGTDPDLTRKIQVILRRLKRARR